MFLIYFIFKIKSNMDSIYKFNEHLRNNNITVIYNIEYISNT